MKNFYFLDFVKSKPKPTNAKPIKGTFDCIGVPGLVPVPVPAYNEDNDNSYRGPGQYNPTPVNPRGYQNNNPGMKQQNPLPNPSGTEDNDFYYYD